MEEEEIAEMINVLDDLEDVVLEYDDDFEKGAPLFRILIPSFDSSWIVL